MYYLMIFTVCVTSLAGWVLSDMPSNDYEAVLVMTMLVSFVFATMTHRAFKPRRQPSK